ncbi:MAG: hypothetical protein HRU19_28040 [Pseudobacteriovorax sp.]|nr:hypothetical protein [Pseudobacteriovorax sp.]
MRVNLTGCLILICVIGSLACQRTRDIDSEKSSTKTGSTPKVGPEPGQNFPAGVADANRPDVPGEESEVIRAIPSEKVVFEIVDFTADPKYFNENNPVEGALKPCAPQDFAMLTISDRDSNKVWLCDKDNQGEYVWAPQTDFLATLVDDTEVDVTMAKAQSFAFMRDDQVYWGWYYSFEGEYADIPVDGFNVYINTEIDGDIERSVFEASFTAFTENATISIFDNTNDVALSVDSRSDGEEGSFKIRFDGEDLYTIEGIPFSFDT